jgi:hypothetical protein
MEKRQRQGKEREIMECVKEYPLKANHTRKKEKSYQLTIPGKKKNPISRQITDIGGPGNGFAHAGKKHGDDEDYK